MNRVWEQVRELLPMAAVVLLCMVVMPTAQASTDTNSNNGTTAVAASPQQQTASVQQSSEQKASATKPKSKAATKPSDKSVLDTDVLESPVAYFRNAFGSEEEDANSTSKSGVVIITVKALIATLLSTVM